MHFVYSCVLPLIFGRHAYEQFFNNSMCGKCLKNNLSGFYMYLFIEKMINSSKINYLRSDYFSPCRNHSPEFAVAGYILIKKIDFR